MRNNIVRYVCVLIFGLGMLACTKPSNKQLSNINFIKRGNEAFRDSSMLTMNFYYTDQQGRHLLDKATRDQPLYMPYIASVWDSLGGFYHTLANCQIGDSVIFSLTAHDFFVKTKGEPEALNRLNLMPNEAIDCYVSFKHQMSLEKFYVLQDSLERLKFQNYQADSVGRNQRQAEEIDTYLLNEGLSAITTASGLKYVIIKKSTGKIASTGDQVSINFEGTLLNGYIFGSSYKTGVPVTFQIGTGEVIPAWDEAARLLEVGTKAVLFVPSDLGFGFADRFDIPGSSILKYQFEVLDVSSLVE